MRLYFKKRVKDQMEFGIIYGGLALLVLCAARFLPVLSFLPSCAFKGLTGLPCPTCGATRSIVHLAHGDLLSSFALNPLIALGCIGVGPIFIYSVLTLACDRPRLGVALTEREKNLVRAGIVLLMLTNWSYLFFAL